MFDFLNNQFQSGFLIDVSSSQVVGTNKPFELLRCSKNEHVIQELIETILKRISKLEAIAFSTMLPITSGAVQAKVRCQYTNSEETHVLVYLDFEAENILMPMDYYTYASVLPCGVVMVDVSNETYHAKYINSALLTMLGYANDEYSILFQRNVFSFIYGDDLQTGLAQCHEQMKTTGGFYLTGRMVRKDGSLLWVNFLGRMATASDGKEYLFTVISESVQLIEQLGQEKQAIWLMIRYANMPYRMTFRICCSALA